MRRLIAIAALMAACLAALPAVAFAEEAEPRILTAAELVDARLKSDGRMVRLQGEAIGDIMYGGRGRVWVNVLSDGVAMGLWVPEEQIDAVESLGDYDRIGTEVEALGVFNAACDVHHGDADVHVTELNFVHEGRPREQPIHLWKLGLAGIFAVVGAVVSVWYRREKQRVG